MFLLILAIDASCNQTLTKWVCLRPEIQTSGETVLNRMSDPAECESYVAQRVAVSPRQRGILIPSMCDRM